MACGDHRGQYRSDYGWGRCTDRLWRF